MGETRVPYVAAVGRSGPAFGVDERLGRRRSEFELLDGAGGVRSAVVELGGLPVDAPSPNPIHNKRRAMLGREYRLRRHPLRFAASPCPRARERGTARRDVRVVEPPEYRGRGRAKVPGSTRDPRHELARQCAMRALALPRVRFTWEPERRWEFDLTWPAPRVAVVIDGGRIGGLNVPGPGGAGMRLGQPRGH